MKLFLAFSIFISLLASIQSQAQSESESQTRHICWVVCMGDLGCTVAALAAVPVPANDIKDIKTNEEMDKFITSKARTLTRRAGKGYLGKYLFWSNLVEDAIEFDKQGICESKYIVGTLKSYGLID